MRRSPSRSRPLRGRHLLALGAVLALVGAVLALPPVSAVFTATTANPANALAADRLQPPSGLTASAVCTGTPVGLRSVSTGSGTTSVTLPTPSGTVAGDVLVAHISHRDPASSVIPPTGWNAIGTEVIGDQIASSLFLKVATGPESAGATFSRPTGSGQMAAGMAAYSGIDTTHPVDAHGGTSGLAAPARTPSVTTTRANTVLLHFVTQRGDTIAAPDQTSPLWSYSSGTGSVHVGIAAGSESVAATGPTPARSFTVTNSWLARTVALRTIVREAGASLTWTASPSSWATGYRGERIAGGTVQATSSAPMGTTTVTDTGLVNGTTYTYRVWTYRGTWVSMAQTTTLTPSC